MNFFVKATHNSSTVKDLRYQITQRDNMVRIRMEFFGAHIGTVEMISKTNLDVDPDGVCAIGKDIRAKIIELDKSVKALGGRDPVSIKTWGMNVERDYLKRG